MAQQGHGDNKKKTILKTINIMDISTTSQGSDPQDLSDSSTQDTNDGMTSTNSALPADDVIAVDQLRQVYQDFKEEIGKVIIGQDEVIERLAICLFSRGHALLMGVPGLAKTLLVSSVAETMDLSFNRIQFTPDLMPADITGTDIIQETGAGHR